MKNWALMMAEFTNKQGAKTMTKQEMQEQALCRARYGKPNRNYVEIIRGFTARGISEGEIIPRQNVFTYQAWQALGRQVRKGERGVKVYTFVPMEKRKADPKTGEEKVEKFSRPRTTTVFHVSQTDPIEKRVSA